MDLLAGYGSDDSGEGSAPPSSAPAAAVPAAPPSLGSALASLPLPQQQTRAGALFASLPPPGADDGVPTSSYAGSGFGLLPEPAAAKPAPAKAPKPAARKVVHLRTLKPLADLGGEEEEQPKKKLRPSTKGLSFLDSLPKPVHSAAPPAGTALGAGSVNARALGGGAFEPPAQSSLPASFFDGNGADSSAAPPASPSAAPEPVYASNDAYRVLAPEAAAVAAGSSSSGADVGPARPLPGIGGYADYGADYGPSYGGDGGGGGGGGQAAEEHGGYRAEYGAAAAPTSQPQHQHHYGARAAHGPVPVRPDGDAMLAAAMAAEAGHGAGGGGGRSDPFAGMNIQFKEVNQKALTYVHPSQAAAKTGLGSVLGKEHELQLRREANAAEPQKMAKRKHQISSLYHASKMKELEMLSDHGGMLKSKRETQAKYGW